MRRFYWSVTIGLVLFALFTTIYLYAVDLNVPVSERNSVVDPGTFMPQERLEKAEDYSRIRYILYFLQLPYEWGFYLLILGLGISSYFRKLSEGVTRWSVVHVFFYLFLLTLLSTLIFIPFDLLRFGLGHYFGVTTQSISSWIGDHIKGYWVNLFLSLPVVWFLFWMIRRSPRRWWIYSWLLSIPLILFLSIVQPLVLDPIFNKFYPLQDEELRGKILALAHEADIPANQVFEVDMSLKTNAMNAYVTGIGPSARIVLWDTTLQKLEEDEILFIMAHEMGHYVMKHIYLSILGSIGLSFLFLWFLSKILQGTITRYGKYWGVEKLGDLAVLPLILLIASLLSFVGSPLLNWVSRTYEHRADVYALQLTQDPQAAITSFQKLSTEGLSHPNPPALVHFFVGTHPTIVERIRFAKQFEIDRVEVDQGIDQDQR